MKKVTIQAVRPNDNPKYIKTVFIEASREGEPFTWEMIKSHDSVHIMVDNTQTREILLVKQVRIPVLVNKPESDGICVECCAGLVDKDSSLAQIAKEEVLEELGYDVDVSKIIPLRGFLSAVGTKGSTVHAFTVEVDESMKVNEGGGTDSEDIEVMRIPYMDVMDFIYGKGDYEVLHTDSTTLFLLTEWIMLKHQTPPIF